jgi:uncharacterized protein with FMN-binding domain
VDWLRAQVTNQFQDISRKYAMMLSLPGKKILLSIHILLIAFWIGTVVSMLLLILFKHSAFSTFQINTVDKIVFTLFDTIIMTVSIAVAITALIFSTFTNWGFLQFYWITTKWLLLIILAILITFFASPVVNGMASLSDVFKERVIDHLQYKLFEQRTLLYTAIQLPLLAFLVFISTFKPWGKRNTKRIVNRKIVISLSLIIGLILITNVILQYTQLNYYRNLPVNEINLESLDDGSYIGEVDYAYTYKVKVSVEDHKIKDIKFIQNRDSHYARLAEGIKYKIINEQKINIDAVTGATTTSQIMLKAVEAALLNPTKTESKK